MKIMLNNVNNGSSSRESSSSDSKLLDLRKTNNSKSIHIIQSVFLEKYAFPYYKKTNIEKCIPPDTVRIVYPDSAGIS